MKVVIVSVDDWAGLYIDGELKSQGHSISNYDLLTHGVINEARGLDGTPFEQQIEAQGSMPQRLADVPAGR